MVGGRGPVKPIISLTHWWDYSELVREGKRDQKRGTLIEVLCWWCVLSPDAGLGPVAAAQVDSHMIRGERDT